MRSRAVRSRCCAASFRALLSVATFEKMSRRLPGAEAVTIPRAGHAPTLDEPEAVAALDRLLARVAGA